MPKISVIVPVYNVKTYLQRCIDSIEAQSLEDFDIYIVDDGSPDGCSRICDEYVERDPRINIIHQHNGGLSAARNSGIDFAVLTSKSEWITFIDSDDWIYPEYLEFLYRAATEEKVQISVCGTVFETNSTHHMCQQQYKVEKMTSEDYWVKKNGDVSVAWEKLYWKQLFNTIRFPVGKIYEDEFTTYLLLYKAENIAVLENNLYIYYFSGNSILRSDWNENKFDNIDSVLEKLEFFRNHGYWRAEEITIKQLGYVIIHDFEIINKEPEKYGHYRKIIDKKISDYYIKRIPQLELLPFVNGRILRSWIIIRHEIQVYLNAISNKIKNIKIEK